VSLPRGQTGGTGGAGTAWVRDRNGLMTALSAGPTYSTITLSFVLPFPTRVAYLEPQDYGAKDRPGFGSVAHWEAQGIYMCETVEVMKLMVGAFPRATIVYKVDGPNSNSFARWLGIVASGGGQITPPPMRRDGGQQYRVWRNPDRSGEAA
jgi:hypothetical protein